MRKIVIYFMSLTMVFCIVVYCKKSAETDAEPEPESGTVYFLVSELSTNHGDSYILPLTDPEHISAAERIVNGTARAQIISARIDYGSGDGNYKNKDLLSPNNRTWSWHVVEFNGFVDVTAEIYDSWPTYVEEHLDEWMQLNNGIIGFWSYTVKQKVDPSELK